MLVSDCSASGSVSLRVLPGSVSDLFGNIGPASAPSSPSALFDKTPPTASISSLQPVAAPRSFSFDLRFSEPVEGVSSSDLGFAGTASGCAFAPDVSTGRTISVRVSGCSPGSLRVFLAPGSVQDAAGNSGPPIRVPAAPATVPN